MKFNRSLFSATSLVRAALVTAMGLGACGTLSAKSARRDIETIVALAPVPVLVKKGHELRTAEAAAANISGAQAFIGAGESMEPVYATGTAIVVTPIDFSQLRAGMSVVYVNQDGRGVAHALVKSTRDGWVAQGANNADRDRELVTARNLVGVITQAYASSDTKFRQEIAGRARAQVALNISKAGNGSNALASQ